MINTKENIIEIECPECTENNTIKLSSIIKCKKCEKSLVGEKFKKPFFSAMSLLLLGTGVGVGIDPYLNINRPSVKTEYKMMKQCIEIYGNSKSVRDNCTCAVKSMAGVVDAQKARTYGSDWLADVLNDKYNNCKG